MLQVIYLIFNEGYSATAGDDWMRPALCEEALRLGRILAGLVPKEPEVLALVALMEIQASRSKARVDRRGGADPAARSGPVEVGPLVDWSRAGALDRVAQLGGTRGSYAIQAAIAACHARAATADDTDWARIAALYADLGEVSPSPIVELNRAVAVGMASGPAAGLGTGGSAHR